MGSQIYPRIQPRILGGFPLSYPSVILGWRTGAGCCSKTIKGSKFLSTVQRIERLAHERGCGTDTDGSLAGQLSPASVGRKGATGQSSFAVTLPRAEHAPISRERGSGAGAGG